MSVSQQVQVRPAQPQDVHAIAALLVEGFGQQYGGVLGGPAGQRMYERIYAMWPERLHDLIVAVDHQGVPIGVAGLRVAGAQSSYHHHIAQVMREELGFARFVQHQLWVRLTAPPPYVVQRHEAYVHSLTVTSRWRGHGLPDALLDRLHTLAGALGKTRVVVEVVEGNLAAHRLYERHGYVVRQLRRGPLARLPGGASPRLLLEKQLAVAWPTMVEAHASLIVSGNTTHVGLQTEELHQHAAQLDLQQP